MKLYQRNAHDIIQKYGIKSKISRKFVADNFDRGVIDGYAKEKYSNLLGYPAGILTGLYTGGWVAPTAVATTTGMVGYNLIDRPKAAQELKEKYKYKFGPSKIHKNRL